MLPEITVFSWSTTLKKPRHWRREKSVLAWPFKLIRPASSGYKRVMTLAKVLLPAPVAPEYSTRSEPNVKMDTPLGADERERLLLLLAKFAELSWDDAGLICSMLAGKTLDRIAQERKISPQALHARWTKLITRNPAWKALTNGMIGSGRGRKASAEPAQSQMELF